MAGDAVSVADGTSESPQLRARRERMSGRPRRRKGGPLLARLLALAFLALAVLVLFPGEVRDLFGLGASESEDRKSVV